MSRKFKLIIFYTENLMMKSSGGFYHECKSTLTFQVTISVKKIFIQNKKKTQNLSCNSLNCDFPLCGRKLWREIQIDKKFLFVILKFFVKLGFSYTTLENSTKGNLHFVVCKRSIKLEFAEKIC